MKGLQTFLQMCRSAIWGDQVTEYIHLLFELGAFIDENSGFYRDGNDQSMADFRFYRVNPGDRLINNDPKYEYNLKGYSEEVEESWIYTYSYQGEENWASYQKKFCEDKWHEAEYIIARSGWIRITVRRSDRSELKEEDRIAAQEAISLIRQKEEYRRKDYYKKEIRKTVRTVMKKQKQGSLIFGLMTDSHYVVNSGWNDSVANLHAVNDKVKFNAMIHLGDLTDGMIPLKVTKEYVDNIMKDLKGLGVPVYLTLGNHDSNYFRNNPERMTEKEQSEYYLNKEQPWYYVDFSEWKLRCLFLHSFDPNQMIRYGFPQEEVGWVKDILLNTPNDFSVLVFSHVPLLPEMHFWSDKIRNSDEMLDVLEQYVEKGGVILAYVHGHNHADQIVYTGKFPIIAIGCAKCEDFKDKKPEGSITYDRKMGTVSQELWDVMVVDTKSKKIDFVRFGAGEDRTIEKKWGDQQFDQTG